MIYLDNAATTQMLPEVFDKMAPFLTNQYGNPGSKYDLGFKSKNAIEEARVHVANLINAEPCDIIFTGSGTESNNLSIKSMVWYLNSIRKTVIVSGETEHDSIIASINDSPLIAKYLSPTPMGNIDTNDVINAIDCDASVGMVSLMYINNETGSENDIISISRECNKRGIIFHTDCVQALGSVVIDIHKIGCDIMSMSSHKICGPKGVGAVYIKDKSKMRPLISGGSLQEYGLRGGTENVPGIVGFGEACRILKGRIENSEANTLLLKNEFILALRGYAAENSIIDKIHFNGDSENNRGKIVSFRVDGVDAEALVMMAGIKGVCISAGAACSDHEQHPNRVLKSMGYSDEESMCSVRVSFSGYTSVYDAILGALRIIECAKELIRIRG